MRVKVYPAVFHLPMPRAFYAKWLSCLQFTACSPSCNLDLFLMTASERKVSSVKKLASLGIALTDDLPALEEEAHVQPKTAQQIAKRILILSYLNCVVYDPSLQQEVMRFMIHERLWDEVTAQEKALVHKPKLSEQEIAEIQWRSESIWLMLWALNKVKNLDLPKNEVNTEEIFSLIPGFFENTSDYISTAKLRPRSDILDEADFAFRLNWALRESAQRNQTLVGINEGVARERYISLNWILGITTEWHE